jgi:hypothetical protein
LVSASGIDDFRARCTFSKARAWIWCTRSRETPNSAASPNDSLVQPRVENASLALLEHG